MSASLQQLLAQANQEYRGVLIRSKSQAEAENRAMTSHEIRYLDEAARKVEALRERLGREQGNANFTAALATATGGTDAASRGNGHGGGQGGSVGQQIIASNLGQWLIANRRNLPTGKWTSPPDVASEIAGYGSPQLWAATITSDAASGGDLIVTDYQRGILPLPQRELTIADLLAPGTTDSNMVGYMKETSVTNAAAAVAEGAEKPESTIVFDGVTDPVRKIATWIPVTDEMLEDVPAFRAYLDARLRLFVQLAEDDQLLNGDGTAPNFSGVLDRSGLATPIARTTETNPDVILAQISAIETATQLPVDAVVMHPNNWNNILLLKDGDGNYIAGGGPFVAPQRKTIWGRAVAVTPAIAAGTALVGAFKSAAVYFRRGGLRVEASNSHADFWITNKWAVRAETRGALAVVRASAFGLVTNLTP